MIAQNARMLDHSTRAAGRNGTSEAGMTAWDEAVDLVVAGSGAAGMTGALLAHDLGARTVVIEKGGSYGGSTALSGGTIWVPSNHLMAQKGIRDSAEEGLKYLEMISRGQSSPERLRTYLETAPQMVRYLAEHSHVRFECMAEYPDYYPELPGGKPGGRSIEPEVFDALELGDEFFRQRMLTRHTLVMGFLNIKASEFKSIIDGDLPAMGFVTQLALAYLFNLRARLRTRHHTRLTLGPALAGRLRRSLMDRQVPLWLHTPLRDLVVENGRVVGVVAEKEGRKIRLRARKGVLLAAGGFERNDAIRQKYQRHPIGEDWTAGSPTNTGDWVGLGLQVGAGLDLMEEAWWSPVVVVPGEDRPRVMIAEKGLPASLIVNQRGERFMNEAAPYNDIVQRMYAANAPDAPSIPAYFIFDRAYRWKYATGPLYPAFMQPDWTLPRAIKKSFLKRAPTLPALAAKLGMEGERLEATIRRFNELARSGRDADHGRGESLQDRYYSDPHVRPNPCLAPLERAPFYAFEVYPGDLGTKGGLRTDVNARVLTDGGDPIPGLYAAGNCSASIMGNTYPGAGGTIGPAMTFGYIAARHAIRDDEPASEV
jgi:3-oxosteroid 1-dehydrogenase